MLLPIKKLQTRVLPWLLLACMLASITGCTPNNEQLEYVTKTSLEFRQEGASVTLHMLVPDVRKKYRIQLYLRHSNQQDCSLLPLEWTLSCARKSLVIDTLHLPLSVETGKWQGSGVAFTQTTFELSAPVLFPRPGLYEFSFRPLEMPQKTNGVENIGIQLIPWEE